MECPRGSLCKESTHKVVTLAFGKSWWEGVEESHLPITVEQRTSTNGRTVISIYSKSKLIHKRG